VEAWAAEHDVEPLVVWEPRGETADEWIVREAGGYSPYWLVTSDRELRELAGPGAARVIGGGSFARELLRRR
jgi:rRNA-processing protein FCF1